MKHLSVFVFLIVACAAQARQVDTAALRNAAIKVQKAHAPDKRSVYFNLTFRRDSAWVESSSSAAIRAMEEEVRAIPGARIYTTLLPSGALKGMEFGVANLSVCNNRATPQNAAEMLTQMIMGTPVEVLKKQGGYYLVRTPDGYLSWTDGAAVGLMDKAAFEEWKNAPKVVFTADYGHALATADANSIRVSDLVNGNILRFLGNEKNYFKVQFPDKRIGYIPRSDAVLYQKWVTRPNPGARQLLDAAKKLMGVPYLWGGTSVKGVDCSGFTKTAYFLNGIIIPRDASQQALIGIPVDVLENENISVEKCLANLLPGDLLFFSAAKRRGVNGGRVSHTAIYMGGGKFIQAAGMVRINSLVPGEADYDEAQSVTLVGARRILTAIGQPEITRVAEHPLYKQDKVN